MEYKAAVALNNIGARLIELKCYVQALKTIGDAIYLLKRRQRQSETEKKTTDVAGKLMRANIRLAHPEPVNVRHGYDVMELFPDGLVPLMIEDTHPDVRYHTGCPDLECGVLLFNYALVHLLLSKDTNQKSKMKERAIALLQMADLVLDTAATETEDYFHLRDLMMTNMSVVALGLLTLNVAGSEEERRLLDTRKMELQANLEAMDDMRDVGIESHCAAAA